MQARTIDDASSAAQAMLGRPVRALTPMGTGANSSIFRVDVDGGRYALKCYPVRQSDPRQRAANEWKVLRFLRDNGLASVPQPIRVDVARGFLLMEWIEGGAVEPHRDGDIDAAVEFVAAVFDLSRQAEGSDFPLASEACLSGADLRGQIAARRAQFVPHDALDAFLKREFDPAFERALAAARARDFEAPLPADRRRLIPADFGFHNAIRQPDGALRFIDFDYFGWDDPAKLVGDFVLHPAMRLSAADARRFVGGVRAKLADDRFDDRLRRFLPLYALRWTLILLNIFRADRQAPDGSRPADWAGAADAQLAKAERMCARAHALLDRAGAAEMTG